MRAPSPVRLTLAIPAAPVRLALTARVARVGLVVAVLSALAGPAGAQTAPALPREPTKAELKKAKKLFDRGGKWLKKAEWDKAIAAYREAIAIAPGVGAIHVNLARAHAGAGQCGPALLHFQAYLAIKPDAADRAKINEERKACVLNVGDVSRLTVEVQAPADDDDEELAPMPGGGGARGGGGAQDGEDPGGAEVSDGEGTGKGTGKGNGGTGRTPP